MANLQKILDSLQPYVISIRYVDGLQVVDVIFKEGWTVPNSEIISKVKGDEQLNYYMLFSDKEGIGIDELLDFVTTTIKVNLEREKKHELLKEKVNELKEIFKKNSLDKLKQLKFLFTEETLVPSIDEFKLDEEFSNELQTLSEISTKELEITKEIESEKKEEVKNEALTEEDLELIEEELRAENFKKFQKIKKETTQNKKLAQKIELPPKKILETIGSDNEPDCDCGPNEACNKCIAYKDL